MTHNPYLGHCNVYIDGLVQVADGSHSLIMLLGHSRYPCAKIRCSGNFHKFTKIKQVYIMTNGQSPSPLSLTMFLLDQKGTCVGTHMQDS